MFFESHPRYITDACICHIRKFLPEQEISIGMGFDAKSSFVRNTILNKNISLEEFKSAVALLKNFDIETIGYVSLKPPFLTEIQGIREAIVTGRYIQNIGVDIISIEPIAIQPYTIQMELAKVGEYRVPWLWSCIEVAKELTSKGRVLIGGDAFLPVPLETASNCPKCTDRINSKIRIFNKKQDISVLDGERCECHKKWCELLEQENYIITSHAKIHNTFETIKRRSIYV